MQHRRVRHRELDKEERHVEYLEECKVAMDTGKRPQGAVKPTGNQGAGWINPIAGQRSICTQVDTKRKNTGWLQGEGHPSGHPSSNSKHAPYPT